MTQNAGAKRWVAAAVAAGLAVALAAAIVLVATDTQTVKTDDDGAGGPRLIAPAPVHENLNATAWVQTAAEYRALTLQAYATASARLAEGLADRTWSAALEQIEIGGFEQLPPAVILDLDETVLDNSPYQARLVIDDAEFATATWNEWVREGRARLVPGVAAFIEAASDLGVAVFWVTNRNAEVEAATRDNLLTLGLPVVDDPDNLLTSGERPDWGSDKGTRRRYVASTHRIVLQLGDNLGDFLSDVSRDVATRQRLLESQTDFWGSRWIVLPNPQYGSWDGALIDYQYGLPLSRKRALKAAALEPMREEAR